MTSHVGPKSYRRSMSVARNRRARGANGRAMRRIASEPGPTWDRRRSQHTDVRCRRTDRHQRGPRVLVSAGAERAAALLRLWTAAPTSSSWCARAPDHKPHNAYARRERSFRRCRKSRGRTVVGSIASENARRWSCRCNDEQVLGAVSSRIAIVGSGTDTDVANRASRDRRTRGRGPTWDRCDVAIRTARDRLAPDRR